MRRVDTSEQLANLARAAQGIGNHERAAEFFAEAVKVLIVESTPRTSAEALAPRGRNADRDPLAQPAAFDPKERVSAAGR
jgi:hypothetical protein